MYDAPQIATLGTLTRERGLLAGRLAAGYDSDRTATLAIELPTCLTLQGKSRAELEQRSKFLLALKYFELGEITSGQAARMAGMGRVAFLNEASRSGVAVIDMNEEEMEREFAHV
jgi:predicted HTH domain antitoxin